MKLIKTLTLPLFSIMLATLLAIGCDKNDPADPTITVTVLGGLTPEVGSTFDISIKINAEAGLSVLYLNDSIIKSFAGTEMSDTVSHELPITSEDSVTLKFKVEDAEGTQISADAITLSPVLVIDNCTILYPPLDTVISSHNAWTKTHYRERIASFMSDSLQMGDIVMLGNSLTELGGNWATRLGKSNVKNRGIAGDNTYGVMARINEIRCTKPSLVFLEIGTNDLWLNDSPEKIASNILILASSIKESKNTTVYVQTIMPVSFGHEKAEKINQIHELLRAANSDDYVLIDTFEEMSDEKGALASVHTTDGVHLTELAYQKWSEFLKQYLVNE